MGPLPLSLTLAQPSNAGGAPVQGAPSMADNGPWTVNFGSGTASNTGAANASQAAPGGLPGSPASSWTMQDWALLALAFFALVLGVKMLRDGHKAS